MSIVCLIDWLALFCFGEEEESHGQDHIREVNSGESQFIVEEERNGAIQQRESSRMRLALGFAW